MKKEESMRTYFVSIPYLGCHYRSQEKPLATCGAMIYRLDSDVARITALVKEKEA